MTLCDRLTEFRFDENFPLGNGTPVTLDLATLATTFILVDDPEDLVWLNVTVHWFVNLSASQTRTAAFDILRNGQFLTTSFQTVFNPLGVAATVNNVARLQFIDRPLLGQVTPPVTPVVYTLNGRNTGINGFTNGPITFSAAEIEGQNLLSI